MTSIQPHQNRPLTAFFVALLGLVALEVWGIRDTGWRMENLNGIRFQVNFGLSVFIMGALLWSCRGLGLRQPRAQWLWLLTVATAYFIQTAYFGVYKKYITVFDVRFFLQDPWLSLSLFAEHGHAVRPLVTALIASAFFYTVMHIQAPSKRWTSWLLSFLGLGVFAFISLNWFGTPAFQTAPVAYAGTLLRATDLSAGKNSQAKNTRPTLAAFTPAPNAPDVIWIIGESLNTVNMQIYGYPRATTPALKRLQQEGQVLAFQNALAASPRTMSSVPYILSGLQGVDPQGMIYSTPSIFNYAKSAGYKTGLITSQDFQWRNIDKLFVDKDLDHFQQGTDFSSKVDILVGADDHQMLERGVLPFILKASQTPSPFLLVIQMSGSHTPYADQVPQAMKQFLPEETPTSINAYDNSVWYTDRFLGQLIPALRKQRPNAWIFFTSDHGQDVSGTGNQFHGSLTEPVVHVPLLVFAPSGQSEKIKSNVNSPTAHADIFATTLDLIGLSPVVPIDGTSLLRPIAASRMRVSTSYVKTLHNDPVAILVFGDGRRYQIQFDQGSVLLDDGKTTIPYADLPADIKAIFDQRLKGQR